MDRKTFNIFSYLAIGLIFVFLMLMIFKAVPPEWFIYILGISIFLFLIRLFFRIYFIIQDRKKS